MTNMFSGNRQKNIPKNLNECYKTDDLVNNLWVWCERLEVWGQRICVAMAIIGIITIISNGIEASNLLKEAGIDENEMQVQIQKFYTETGIRLKTVFEVVIEEILLWGIYCFLEFCAYHILALLVGSLASIVQHTKITANVALYNASNKNTVVDESQCETEQGADEIVEETTPISMVEDDKKLNSISNDDDDKNPEGESSIVLISMILIFVALLVIFIAYLCSK